MIHQQDPVGLITFDEKIRHSLPPQVEADAAWATCSRCWRTCKPTGETDIAQSLVQVAAMLRHRSLVMIFSDLLAEPEPVIASAAPAAARRARRDPVPHSRRGRSALSVRRHGRIRRARNARKAAGRRRQLPGRLPRARSRRFARPIAASAFRAASTTCRSTPACSSTGPDRVPGQPPGEVSESTTGRLPGRPPTDSDHVA